MEALIVPCNFAVMEVYSASLFIFKGIVVLLSTFDVRELYSAKHFCCQEVIHPAFLR